MKTYNELNYSEQKEIKELIGNWLSKYTHEVHLKVLPKINDIISNEMAMKLLKELKKREEEEFINYLSNIHHLMENFDFYQKFDVHSSYKHAQSYRDVLYDMYIR